MSNSNNSPPTLPTIVTSDLSSSTDNNHRPSTPPNTQSTTLTPVTPPPTFSITDTATGNVLPPPIDALPPSPGGSDSGFVQKSSLGLRGNEVDTDAKRQARDLEVSNLGVSYAPSTSTAYSSGASETGSPSGGKHERRPSAALSFASTVPEGAGTGGKYEKEKEMDEKSRGEKEVERENLKEEHSFFGVFKRKKKGPIVVGPPPDPSPQEMLPFPQDLTPSKLYELLDPKSIDHLTALGGTAGVLRGLKVDPAKGLKEQGDEIPLAERARVYGENKLPTKKGKTLLQLMWIAYQDKVLLILSVAAVVSLALGVYQDVGTEPESYESTRCENNTCYLPQVDWVEGVAITIAILIVVLVGAVNDYQKERQFQKLNAQKEDRKVKLIRNNGAHAEISVYDVVVGDILKLEQGEIIPVDGIFLGGHNVRCDESSATGESDAVRKVAYEELGSDETRKADCFLLSGSKVVEGVGSYVVTGVGVRSFNGRLLMSLQGDTDTTPLQLKLNKLAELIAKLGSAAGLVLFSALMIRFFVHLGTDPGRSPNDKAQNFIQILIISVTVVVVAVPEGLPLAVTLALAFATRRMTKQNLLVRVLAACETMANATVICTDKTGTLTTNQMSVVAGSIGVHLKFVKNLGENEKRTNANDDVGEAAEAEDLEPRSGRLDFSTDMAEINSHLSPALRNLLNDSVAINSTAVEEMDPQSPTVGGFVGSKTETALLSFAKNLEWNHWETTRNSAKVVEMVPFSSERKAMGVVVQLASGKFRLFLKGASEVLAKLSTHHVVVAEEGSAISQDEGSDAVETAEFTAETRSNIDRTIIFYANQSLRTIALCSRDFESWPPKGAQTDEEGKVVWGDLAKDLTLVAITAIEDPLRDGVAQAVATCQKAGVQVKMCTGDNVLTARSIALQCGIFTPNGIILEGPVFRKLSDADKMAIIPRLQVLARCSPEDKKTLVDFLKDKLGEVVGVSGDGSNDAPALKAANVGFAMGIAGTEVAKEASDIVVMDDNFTSMVTAIMWGRCVNDSVKKFLQFQISVNITAVIITFITAVASDDEESVLTAVQLLWVNLIMDTFAALALATDPADPASLDRKPDRKFAPLISAQMWMMIIGQAIFQTITALVLHFAGHMIFNFNSTDPSVRIDQDNELKTLVFNTFVFSQVFNQLNARRLDRGLNVFRGIHKNYYFMVIFCIMAGGQALIVNFGGAAFQVVRIGGRDWGISIALGALSLPIAVLIRLLPPGPWERFLIRIKAYPDPNALPVHSLESEGSPEKSRWNEGIDKVIDNLNTYTQIRGGRIRGSSIVLKSRSKQLRDKEIEPMSLLAMVPTLVASATGAGWRPQEGTLSDPAGSDPSKSSVALFTGKGLTWHPESDPNDPLVKRFSESASSPTTERGQGHSRQRSTASAISAKSGHSRASSLQVPPTVIGASLAPPGASSH